MCHNQSKHWGSSLLVGMIENGWEGAFYMLVPLNLARDCVELTSLIAVWLVELCGWLDRDPMAHLPYKKLHWIPVCHAWAGGTMWGWILGPRAKLDLQVLVLITDFRSGDFGCCGQWYSNYAIIFSYVGLNYGFYLCEKFHSCIFSCSFLTFPPTRTDVNVDLR